MKKKLLAGLVIGLFTLSIGGMANATPISINDFSGSETLIDFNSGYSISGNTVTTAGVSFVSSEGGWWSASNWSSYFDNISGASLGYALADATSDTLVTINAGFSVNRIGILLSTTPVTEWSLSAYASDNSLIETVTQSMPSDSEAVFLGLESTLSIDHFIISETGAGNGHVTLMDDLRFESVAPVPEPATILLFGTGIAGLVGARIRRKN